MNNSDDIAMHKNISMHKVSSNVNAILSYHMLVAIKSAMPLASPQNRMTASDGWAGIATTYHADTHDRSPEHCSRDWV